MPCRWLDSTGTWSLQSSLVVALSCLCIFNCAVAAFLLFLSRGTLSGLRGKHDAGACVARTACADRWCQR